MPMTMKSLWNNITEKCLTSKNIKIMKLGEMVNAYRILGEAKDVEVSEMIKVYKYRKEARPHVEAFEAYFQDVQKTFDSLSEEDKAALNKAVEEELNKEVEFEFEKLKVETIADAVKQSGLKAGVIEAFAWLMI